MKNSLAENISRYAKYILLAMGAVLIAAGLLNDEYLIVLQKAAAICLECIGLG